MPEFILNRTFTLSGKGHMINFVKGKPVSVPPELAREAIGIGAEPVNADKEALLPTDQLPEEQLTDADKQVLLFAAFEQIVAKNDSQDFGGDGKPTVEAVKKLVNFGITKKELTAQYQKFREEKAA